MSIFKWIKSLFVYEPMIPRRHYKRWTEDEINSLKRLVELQHTLDSISMVLGRTKRSIKRKIRELVL